jgi:hypothetical protein
MKSSRKRKTILVLLVIIFVGIKNLPQSYDNGVESINSDNLMQTVNVLCSDEFNGRLPGSEGYNEAANFAADKFQQIGLLPAGDKNIFNI